MNRSISRPDRLSVIIDTDLAYWGDDSTCILMLLLSQSVDVVGITTTSGNVWTEQATASLLRLLESVGRTDIEVHAGLPSSTHADRLRYFWNTERTAASAVSYAGALGLGRTIPQPEAPPGGWAALSPSAVSAPDFIIQQVLAKPGKITILELGPAGNLAAALKKEPRVVSLVSHVYFSGGALRVSGNTTNAAEFNVWFDPEAADAVFASAVPMTVVPLDATRSLFFDPQIVNGASSSTNVMVRHIVESVRRAGRSDGSSRVPMWDEAVAAVVIDPSIITSSTPEFVRVIHDPRPEYGATRIATPGNTPQRPVSVVYQIEPTGLDRVFRDLLIH